jgi:hypothetical protein
MNSTGRRSWDDRQFRQVHTDEPIGHESIYTVNRHCAYGDEYECQHASASTAGHFSQEFHVRLDTTTLR